MIILNKKEVEENFENYDFENEEICTWSVQDEQTCFADDNFNGSYDECVGYCEKIYTEPCFYQIALVRLNQSGSVTYTEKVEKFNEELAEYNKEI